MYVVETVNSNPTVIFTAAELIELLDTPKWVFIYFAMGWTTIFAIKFSFLVFFRPLVRNLSRWLEIYYWFSLVFTGVSWVVLVIEPALLCPHVGIAASKCPHYHLGTEIKAALILQYSQMLPQHRLQSQPQHELNGRHFGPFDRSNQYVWSDWDRFWDISDISQS